MLSGNVSVNDDWHDSMGDYSVTLETDAANGTLTLNTDGSFTYEPNEGFAGTDTFNYRVTNERGGFTTATASITVFADVAVPFSLPTTLGSGLSFASDVTPADLDGDGDLDVLAAAFGASDVVWFENLGNGFAPAQTIDASATSVWKAIPGDVDQDGDIDVISGGFSGNLVWYENDGSGTFAPAQTIGTGLREPFVQLVDFDGDGTLDILAVPNRGTDVFLFPGVGDGQFGERQALITDLVGAYEIQAHDFDGDGDIDFAVSDVDADVIHVVLNAGDGTIGTMTTISAGDRPAFMEFADFNGDGVGDLLSYESGANKIAWYAGNSDGFFGTRQELPDIVGGSFAIATADVDGNGTIDVISGGYRSDPRLVWLPNHGDGTFGEPVLISQSIGTTSATAAADFDGDGDIDVVAAGFGQGRIRYFENGLGDFENQIIPPADRTYPAGQNLDVLVHFGFPVTVTGTPGVSLQVGDQTVEATYLSGSSTTELLFRYSVAPTDADDNGIELVGNAVNLNDGSIIGPTGDPVDLTLPMVDLSGVVVNGSTPFVQTVERSSLVNPTASAEVTFRVTFNEAVTGVDTDDFAVTLDGVTGAMITNVTGSGEEYLVTLSTGTGSGTIGLQVLETATVEDGEGNPLVEGFLGGEVFSIHRRLARTITNFFTEDHGDIRVDYESGIWDLDINPDALDGPFEADEVLIVGGPDSQTTMPSDPAFEFIGDEAGADIYILPQSSVPPTIPDLGLGASGIATGTFASYANEDSRVDATGPWVEIQLVDMRGPTGGQFSLFSSGLTAPTVWMATSDGISDEDSVFIPAGSHNHFNWAFTEPGIYEIDVFASGFVDINDNGTFDEGVDRYTESGIVTYYFSIDPPGGPQPYTIAADAPVHLASETATVIDQGMDNAVINGTYQIVVSGNFDSTPTGAGAEADDLLFWDPASGNHRIVFGDGTVQDNPFSALMINGNDYTQVVAGDFDGGGGTDLFFWNPATGNNRLIHVSGGTGSVAGIMESNVAPATAVNGNDFTQVVVGDFDGGGVDDLFFWDPVTGRNRFVHFEVVAAGSDTDLNNHQTDVIPTTMINGDYSIVKAGQFEVGGLDELLFIDMGSGQNRTVLLSTPDAGTTTAFDDVATNYFSTTLFNGNDFDRVEVADLNGDGLDDVFAWNSQTGANRIASTSLDLETPPAHVDDAIAFQAINGDYNVVARLTEDVFSDPNADELFFWNPTTGRNRTTFLKA